MYEPNIRTRVVLGCAVNPAFVSSRFASMIQKNGTLYSPMVILKEKPKIVYEVPYNQLNFCDGFTSKDLYYVICGDNFVEYTEIVTPLSKFEHRCKRTQYSRDFDRAVVYKEEVRVEFFVVSVNAKYSNVWLYTNRFVFYIVAWGVSWRLEIRNTLLNPQHSDADPDHIWFTSNHYNEIILSTYDQVNDDDIRRILSVLLPRNYNQFDALLPPTQ